jgi:thymidylate synthase (FAD)
MMLDFDRLVFAPGVAMVANTVFVNAGLDDAIVLSGAEDIAIIPGTPLFDLVGRVYENDNERGGNGDDLAEFGGRQCYRSWRKGRGNAEYIANVQAMGHGSVFEHASMAFQLTGVSRSLTHELIRHRVGTAYSQESQRYVDAKDIRFVVPPLIANSYDPEASEGVAWKLMMKFRESCQRALDDYIEIQPMLKELCEQAHAAADAGDVKLATSAQKRANEAARAVLPNATETRLLFTVNLRQMFHMLTLRGGEPADLEIRRLAVALLDNCRDYAPNFFAALEEQVGNDGLAEIRSANLARF